MNRTTLVPEVDVRRADDRFKTDIGWLDSKHSFSFSRHWDPANTHHGLLLVNNDDIVLPGRGFETHPHRDMEIVTWVLRGSLVHQDSIGTSGVIYPGLAQRMSAGTGILHSEKNDSWTLSGGPSHSDPVHFVQMWVVPDEDGIKPGYEQLDIDDELRRGDLVAVASGMDRHDGASAIRIRNRHAALHAARLGVGQSVALPDAPYLHLFVPRGTVDVEGAGTLVAGDAVRFTATGGQRVTALEPAEILVWEMHAAVAATSPVRYSSFLVDSARWEEIRVRPGDIIISTPAKCGTTWTQMICGLLIFQTPALPQPLDRISPWLEMRLRRRSDVLALYEAQPHRRFIKSHTPLDGLPAGEDVTYICVGRDPRDVALSWNKHLDNIDLEAVFTALAASIEPGDEFGPPPHRPTFANEQDAFLHWVDDPTPVEEVAMSLAGMIHHLTGFWQVRDRPDVVLLHYDDLQRDPEGEMRRLAARLDIEVPDDRWPALVKAASFSEMRRKAEMVAPDTDTGIWKSTEEFFHRGTSGQWREILDDDAVARYEARVRELAPPDLAAWLRSGTPRASRTAPVHGNLDP